MFVDGYHSVSPQVVKVEPEPTVIWVLEPKDSVQELPRWSIVTWGIHRMPRTGRAQKQEGSQPPKMSEESSLQQGQSFWPCHR